MASQRVQNTTYVIEKIPPKEYYSWLDYWRSKVGNNVMPKRCFCCRRFFDKSDELVAGCVQKVDEQKKRLYFVPLCYTCNNPDNNIIFEVEESDLVPIP